MGSESSSSSMVALSIMALTVVAVLDGCMAQMPSICNVSAGDLMACKPAVTPRNPPPPSEECCSVLSKADLKCLCSFNFTPLLPSLGMDPKLALQLPEKCHLPHPSYC